jgi:CRISPR/Cas system-associated exonuclease Cas4 (RecB family)
MFKLSPSDFAYLYEECKLCYWLKVKHQIYQPSMPMPGVFAAINTRLQGNLVGKSLQTLSADLPEGRVVTQEGWVESRPVPGTQVYIKGKYDLLVQKPDKTYLLVDLKISQPQEEKIVKFQTQLGAYHFALQNPRYGKPIQVTQMGLLIFYPDKVTFTHNEARLSFPPRWLEVPIDERVFFDFMKKVDTLLAGPKPPESKTCKWCQYRHVGEKLTHRV